MFNFLLLSTAFARNEFKSKLLLVWWCDFFSKFANESVKLSQNQWSVKPHLETYWQLQSPFWFLVMYYILKGTHVTNTTSWIFLSIPLVLVWLSKYLLGFGRLTKEFLFGSFLALLALVEDKPLYFVLATRFFILDYAQLTGFFELRGGIKKRFQKLKSTTRGGCY